MRAARLTEIGGPEKLQIESVPQPIPQPGEVLIRLERAALNRRDLYITRGLYPRIRLPCTLGSDGTGTVAAHGPGVRAPAVGSPVVIDPQLGWDDDPAILNRRSELVGMPGDGTFAEFICVPACNVYPRPAGLTADEAAAIPLAGLTAYRAVFTRGGLRADDAVLITGIGSGVQSFVLLYAKHAGARTVVTSSSDEKLSRARALGADVTINYRTTPDWHKAARDATGGGPSLTVDSAGGETLARVLEIARVGGRIVTYGGTTGDATIRPYALFWKHLTLMGTSMGSPDDFAKMLALFAGGLRPVVDCVVPLEAIHAGLAQLDDAAQFGKVVVAVDAVA
ncbi:MAG: zinc-binding dehydrogenase [Vulcanimicrobiaceae bacterium]